MSKSPIATPCTAEAIHIAWNARRLGYRRADGPALALRRRQKGLTAEAARAVLGIAAQVIDEAIRLAEPRNLARLEEFRTRVPNGPSAQERTRLERKLQRTFPSCTADAARSALQLAIIYHIL